MADRTCPRCGQAFAYPSGLRKHKERVTPCAPILSEEDLTEKDLQKPYKCDHCGIRFTCASSLSRHKKERCKVLKKNGGMDRLCAQVLASKLDEQMRRTEEMERKLEEVGRQCRPTFIQYVNGGQVLNSITINVFGKETTDHISRDKVKELLDSVIRATSSPTQGALEALIRAAALIYSDPKHPENLTCYLPNDQLAEGGDGALVHGESGWEVQPFHLVLPPMTARACDLLFGKQPFVENASKYGDLLRALRENEEAYKQGRAMRPILVRNKDLLEQVLRGGADGAETRRLLSPAAPAPDSFELLPVPPTE